MGLLSRRLPVLVLWLTEACLLLALAQVSPWFHDEPERIALGLVLGGITGNVADRLGRGGVLDFLDVGFWPVFNLADVAIIVGALTAAFSKLAW